MKKTLFATGVSLFLGAVGAMADEASVTLKGTLQCGKCSLSVDDDCTDVIVVKGADGGEAAYHLAGAGDEGFHKNICKKAKEGEVTGVVTEADGKKTVTIAEAPKLAE